jgi:hypothetical protein
MTSFKIVIFPLDLLQCHAASCCMSVYSRLVAAHKRDTLDAPLSTAFPANKSRTTYEQQMRHELPYVDFCRRHGISYSYITRITVFQSCNSIVKHV